MPASICDLKPGETALDGLKAVADLAQTLMNTQQQPDAITIAYPPDQEDSAVSWQKRGPQEPAILPPYPEAVAFLSAFEKSSALRRVRANAMMDAYYEMDVQGLPKNKLDAQNVRLRLEEQRKATDDLLNNFRSGKINFRAALDIANELGYISRYLSNLDPTMAKIPCIVKCIEICGKISTYISSLGSVIASDDAVNAMKIVLNDFSTVLAALSSIINGYSIITNNETISNFFLMRLLVGYKISPAQSATSSCVTIASSQLTALLHNKQDWLFEIMERMIANLATMLGSDEHVAFFLKGGRGLNYLLGTPDKGENDWDTQILINPHLPNDEWWATYNLVRDAVNNRLTRYEFIFSANLMANAPALIKATKDAGEAMANDSKATDGIFESALALAVQASIDDQDFLGDEDMALENQFQEAMRNPSGSCKAELIDVGLPRVCTIELLEQWDHVRPGITRADNKSVPYPGAPYFIDEFIGMIRECDAGVSPSPTKRPKRLKRLLSVLSDQVAGFTSFCKAQAALVTDAQLILSRQKISVLNGKVADLATIMLGQFCTAYELAADPKLAQSFDALAAKELGAATVDLPQGIDEQADLVFAWCKALSAKMMDHFVSRGKFLGENNNEIATLVSQTVNGIAMTVNGVMEGSFAICQHHRLINGATRNKVAPAKFAAVSLYMQNCLSNESITNEMFEEVVTTVETLVINLPFFDTVTADAPTRTIRVFAKNSIALGEGGYTPLVVEFTLRSACAGLNTVIVQQGTLLALQPLTIWCRTRAAGVNEWATRLQLAETYGALIEMAAPVRMAL